MSAYPRPRQTRTPQGAVDGSPGSVPFSVWNQRPPRWRRPSCRSFGVTRQDLYDISQQGRRQGNVEPQLWAPGKATKPNEAAAAVMNPANAQRIVDTLAEAQKYPELIKGMVPWYVMDPAYQQMVRLVGPERAAEEYTKFNMSMTPFSAGSNVLTEINRGKQLRDDVLTGKAHASWLLGGLGGAAAMGGLAAQDQYESQEAPDNIS
jgi:hypothetical protein